MPDVVCVIRLVVPVGAMVSIEMFLLPYFTISLYSAGSASFILSIIGFKASLSALKIGNAPLSLAIVTDDLYASTARFFWTFTEKSMALSEPYVSPNAASISPSAVIPRPVLRPSNPFFLIFSQSSLSTLFTSSSSGSAFTFARMASIFSISRSTRSSISLIALWTWSWNSSISNEASLVNGLLTYEYRFIAIRRHES